MWPFSNKVKQTEVVDELTEVDDEPKEYGDVEIILIDNEVLELKVWNILTTDHFINFQTSDGWLEIKIDYVKSIRYKEISESNVVSLHKEEDNA